MARLKKTLLILALIALPISLIVNVMMYERYSPKKAVAIVGNRKISKFEYEQALDAQAGKQVLNQLVFTQLIDQAATREGLTPTDAQVQARIAEIQKLSPAAFHTGGASGINPDTEAKLKTQMELENLRMQDTTASDAEVQQFYDDHKNAYAAPSQTAAILVVTQTTNDAAKASNLLSLGEKPDAIARQPGMRVNGVNGFAVNMQAIPSASLRQIQTDMQQMKDGTIKTYTVGPYFFTFKIAKHLARQNFPFSEIRDMVARQVRLQKSPDEATEIALLYQQAHPEILNTRYQAYFADVAGADLSHIGNARKVANAR